MICPIEPIYAIVDVVGSVRVHNIDDDKDAETVGFVNQVLEIIRIALSRARGEVACDMVSEGAVVGVLLHSHQLNAVVATLLDVGKHIICKLSVLGHFAILGAHAHMRLINLQVFRDGANAWILELVI